MPKYPIGVQDFEKIVTGGYTYIDKTKSVYELVNDGNIVFLNRPRRFGKSLLVSTLKYYFEGRRDLFKGLAIDELEKDWTSYPVFHISFSTGEYSIDGTLASRIDSLLNEWEGLYGRDERVMTYSERFLNVIKAAKAKTGLRIDELVGRYYSEDEFVDYRADANHPLPMLYQSGYLTFKNYNQLTSQYLLDFPNDEARRGFLTLSNNYLTDHRPIIKIGCVFSSKTGTISEWKEA